MVMTSGGQGRTRGKIKIGADDPSLTAAGGMLAVTELCGKLVDPHQPDLRQDRSPRPRPGRPVRLPAPPGSRLTSTRPDRIRAQILTGRSRQAAGDDAQQAAGVTEEPPGPEHVRDGRDSLFSSMAVPMTGVPRTLIGREDRRRRISSNSIRMTTPSETTLDSGTALCGRVGVMVVSPTRNDPGDPAKIVASTPGHTDLPGPGAGHAGLRRTRHVIPFRTPA